MLLVSPLNRHRAGAVRGLCTLTGYESVRVGDGVATSQFVGVRREVVRTVRDFAVWVQCS